MSKKLLSLVLTGLLFAGTMAAVTGCNTVEGAGKDVQEGGRAIKDEAREHK